MCDCTTCKFTSDAKGWPSGAPKGKRISDAEYAAHWRHCGAEFHRKRKALTGSPFPCRGTVRSDPRIGYHFPGGQVAELRAGPGCSLRPQEGCPEYTDDVREYVARFCAANLLPL